MSIGRGFADRSSRPRPLQLPAHEELAAIEHVDVLRRNGFDIEIDEEASAGHRVQLAAQPTSKTTDFGLGGELARA